MKIFKNSLVEVLYNEGNDYGIGVWKGSAAGKSADDYKTGMTKIGDLIESKKLQKWIGNMTDLEFISPELQTWTNEQWFPRVLGLGVKYIAVVVSATALARMSVKQIMTKVGETENKYFSSLEEAKSWIQSI